MKNIGITKCMHRTVDDFTTDFGIKARRIIDVVLRPILRLATKRKIIVESYPKLEKGNSNRKANYPQCDLYWC